MPPRKKVAQAVIVAGAVDSDDDLATAATSVNRQDASTMAQATRKTGTKRKAEPAKSRTALKDQTNIPSRKEHESAIDDDTTKPKAKRLKATARSAKAPTSRELDVIPETQQDSAIEDNVEDSIEVDEQDPLADATLSQPRQASATVQRARTASVQPVQTRVGPVARSASVQPALASSRERSASINAIDRERRGADSDLRRQLVEMTKRYESVSLKYENLQEIGQHQAETNFQALKRASDQRIKDANELIASLKRELVELRKSSATSVSESASLQKQVAALNANHDKLQTSNADLKERLEAAQMKDKTTLSDLRDKLQAAQNETKAAEAKLVAARQQLTSVQEVKASDKMTSRTGPSNASEAQKEAKMKENLYSDLTGLIIRGVKQKDGEDEYDCLQTGRNGTLHFHLSVMNDSMITNPKTPSGVSYEDAEFAYEPFLDEGRDRDLLNMLPDYLTEEICFPRCHAVKFYSKVVESMTRKIVVDDD